MADASTFSTKINDAETELSLTDLLSASLDEVAELRSSSLPVGVYEFEAALPPEGELFVKVLEGKDGKPNKAMVELHFVVKDIKHLEQDKDNPIDAATLIDRKHREAFFMTKLPDDLGRLKAFLADTGAKRIDGELAGILNDYAGTRFVGVIRHRPDKLDPDKVYVNISREQKKLKPIT